MDLIPHDEIRPGSHFNFAPMIDFLFLMLALFSTLAISRAALYDSEIKLASIKTAKNSLKSKSDIQHIHLSIGPKGVYKWLTEFQKYPMKSIAAIQEELSQQYKNGIIAQDKSKTEVLLHIDKEAPWESIAQMIFGIRELGFEVRPVYEP